jgi:hypothetical protein
VLCWRALQEGATVLTERNTGRFRFWHDERRFKGGIEKCLVQQSLFAAGEGCRQVYSYCIPDQSRVTLGAGHAVSMITHSLLGTAAAAEAAQQERLGSCCSNEKLSTLSKTVAKTAAVYWAGAGGVRTGGYPKTAPISGPLGFQRPADWDLLWSPARSALKAVPILKAGQLVSAVPGLYSLTKKVRRCRS